MAFNLNGRSSQALPADSSGWPIYQYQEQGFNLVTSADGVVSLTFPNNGTVARVRVAGQVEANPIVTTLPRAGWFSIYNNSAAAVAVSVTGYNDYIGNNLLQAGAVALNIPVGGTIFGDFTSVQVTTAASSVICYRKLP